MQDHRVGVVSCLMALDMSIPADVNAHSARAKIISGIGDSPGMKIRPVIVPNTGFTNYTVVRKERSTPTSWRI